ncbi:glycosyltransferase family 39 protein [Frankia sp. AgB1.9]|uniref:ArnT family glycosyltransferase n=1 Tax=unclassified Frankia TaxID=2632575 RepID=UPI001931ED7D|nr:MULTISPECIES: glycosyltransferase family 39 protein [unclassified Frankia]MBL7489483.1 glycosyltransferase family 39 protein [Frankia sp. AgW1.1]MBL7547787.1 glycosyltransferase family 39 protein [Frankia sp. AgB1.9]MBL7621257.1 glycosyltransferase family 39 protein [Frankia sp. AgB1.8]
MRADEGAWRAPQHSLDPYATQPPRANPYAADASQTGGIDVVETWPGRQAPEFPRDGERPVGSGPADGDGERGGDGSGGGAGGRGSGGGRHGRPGRSGRLLRGRPDDPRWARPALLVLLAATAVLYLWGLGASNYGNSFYAAAVQAGTKSWKAFFFGSIDASNYITVDKPPASLWMMALSGRIFGFSSWSMLVPNALCGVASVGLLYGAVRRVAGPAMGLLAGAVCALTPVAVLMFRFNNPDALLVLLLVFAAYCVTRALEFASWRWLTLAGVLLGFGFLTKMLQAFLVVPAFALAYLIAAPTGLRARIGHVLLSGVGIVVGAGWWVLATILWPASSRPYFGGSGNNSVLGLAFGYNGLGRIFGGDGNGGGGGRPTGQAADALTALGSNASGDASTAAAGAAARAAEGFAGGAPTGAGGGGGGGFGGATGITRMFSDNFGAQISWLLPAALILLVGGLWATRRAPRTDRLRAALVLWGGWTVVTALVFSYMKGTIHEYYSVALAPGIAGTVALGAWSLWQTRDRLVSRAVLAVSCGVTAVWAFVLLGRTDWQSWLRYPVLLTGLLAAVVLLAWPWLSNREDIDAPTGRLTPARRAVAIVALAAAAFGTVGAPAAYALETASVAHTGSTPLAGPASARAGGFGGPGGGFNPGAARGADGTNQAGSAPGGFPGFGGAGGPGGSATGGQPATGNEASAEGGTSAEGQTGTAARSGGGMGMDAQADSAVTKLLSTNAGLYRWVAAVSSSQSAASLELGSGGLPVMAIGGFTGSDNAITLAQFQKYVKDGEIHYYLGEGGGGFGGGGNGVISQITTWVEANYSTVTVNGQTLYDLTKPKS